MLIAVVLVSDCGGSATQLPGYLSEMPTAWLFMVIKEPGVGNRLPCVPVVGVGAGVPGPGVGAGVGIDATVTLGAGANCPLSASKPKVPPTPITTLRASNPMIKSTLPADRRGLEAGALGTARGAVLFGGSISSGGTYE